MEDKNTISIKQIFREANKPEPIETVNKSDGIVKWGSDNLYPQWLNGLVYDNPVHGGIIEQKRKFITSGGVDTKLSDKSVLDAKIDGYSISEICEELALDFEIGNVFCILWKKVNNKWYPKAVPFESIRADKDGTHAHYSENWMSGRQSDDQNYRKIVLIGSVDKKVDTECLQIQTLKPKQRLYDGKKGQRKQLSMSYYPQPSYAGAITDILAGIEMSYFQYSEVVNGFKGGTWINLANGKPPTDEEADKVVNGIKEQASSKETQGGLVITWSDGKEREPSINQINGNDLDKRYQEAKKQCRDSIMVAHGVISPSLFGVFTESMFGSKEEMETAYSLFRENYIKPRQKNIVTPINWAYELLNGVNPQYYFIDYVPEILKPTQVVTTSMSKEVGIDEIKSHFKACGRSKDSVKVLYSRSCNLEDFAEESFTKEYLSKSKFLSEIQSKILELIMANESYGAIAEALDITPRRLTSHLIALEEQGYIDGWKVTDSGLNQIVNETKIEVVYSYEVRPNVPDAKNGSRPFCEFMMNENKVYTKIEIDRISDIVGNDVWLYRGGWYHNPDTNRNTPMCRHEWQQHIILK